MSWWAVFFSVSGRISRAKYWLGVLVFYLFIFAALYVSIDLVESDSVLVLFLPVCWMHFAVAVKRLHDLDRSAWWLVPWLAIPGGQILLGILQGTPGTNRYGASPLEPYPIQQPA